jgi:hypothetical protein
VNTGSRPAGGDFRDEGWMGAMAPPGLFSVWVNCRMRASRHVMRPDPDALLVLGITGWADCCFVTISVSILTMPEAIWRLSESGWKQHAVLFDWWIGVLFFILPFNLFAAMAHASAVSFYAHLYIDKHYHVEGRSLERFAWFRRQRQLHFVHHHLHANSNFCRDRLFLEQGARDLPQA